MGLAQSLGHDSIEDSRGKGNKGEKESEEKESSKSTTSRVFIFIVLYSETILIKNGDV